MKLIKLSLALALGGVAVNYLLKKPGAASGKNAQANGANGAEANDRVDRGASVGNSPNAAERLQSRRPANSLAGSGGFDVDLLGSNAADGEYPRSTGLADFSRGA
jgi:hypothetical protein